MWTEGNPLNEKPRRFLKQFGVIVIETAVKVFQTMNVGINCPSDRVLYFVSIQALGRLQSQLFHFYRSRFGFSVIVKLTSSESTPYCTNIDFLVSTNSPLFNLRLLSVETSYKLLGLYNWMNGRGNKLCTHKNVLFLCVDLLKLDLNPTMYLLFHPGHHQRKQFFLLFVLASEEGSTSTSPSTLSAPTVTSRLSPLLSSLSSLPFPSLRSQLSK